MAAKLSNIEIAGEMFENLLRCKEAQYGLESKEIIAPLMQVQHMKSYNPKINR